MIERKQTFEFRGVEMEPFRTAAFAIGLLALLACGSDGPTSGVVGANGGSVSLSDGKVTVTIPQGALTGTVKIISRAPLTFPSPPLLVPGTVVEILPANLPLAKPVSMRISFASSQLPEGVRSEELRIHVLVSGTWMELGGVVNIGEGWVQFDSVGSFGTFAVLAVPVHEVIVLPSALTRAIGSTGQLAASARDARGNPLPDRNLLWSSGNAAVATVDSNGEVKGVSAGTVQVVARGAEGDPGAATVSIFAPVPSTYANEPAGFTRILEHSLGVLPSGTNGTFGSWYNTGGPRLSVASVADAPESPPGVANVVFPTGWQGGFSPAKFGHESQAQLRAIYFSMRMRILGSDYENHPVFTKIGFFGYGSEPSGPFNEGLWVLTSPASGRVHSAFRLQFMQQGHITRNLTQNIITNPVFTVGPWHQIELLAELNTINVADGRVRIWLDGTLILDYSDVVFRNTANPAGFRGWKFDPTYGGVGDVKSRADVWQVDHVYVSGVPKP